MGPAIEPIPSDPALPARADVVIIGGGIIGTSAALTLAQRGVSVLLCEKGEIAAEQSSRNWGWCRVMGRDSREIPLVQESLKLWRGMNATVGEETGYRQAGILYVGSTEAEMAQHEKWMVHARAHGLSTRLVGSDEVARLMPGAATRFQGAMYTETDGRAEPQLAAPAIARAARRLGAGIMTHCAVRMVDTTGGRVSGVVTEKGRVACDAVLLAGGAWSGLFCRGMDLRLPQLKVLGSVLRTAPVAGGPDAAAATSGFAIRKRLDGGYTVADVRTNHVDIVPDSFRYFFDFIPALRSEWRALRLRVSDRFLTEWRMPKRAAPDRVSIYEQVRILDPTPVESVLRAARARLEAAFPMFRGVATAQSWGGLIDATPDAVPVISPVPAVPGLVVATGFSGHGFGIGPGAGRLAADLVTGAPPLVDPTPYRFSRFSDGSPIRVETGF
ncbi:NAD(P)/FAD-dependent oxidoreductase [Inquilinus sp.]|jgi:glycine/D-amino acid oxidase-like deaminating enzyme|uniref:NAD(P)/FAD-dependent oxidoreductase n=1 Tax=Inquilinus sp. TaxID=1932117 RepID=UPI0037848E36